jgi:tripartite-type tricarboxylate transporter receptor subunit TctC
MASPSVILIALCLGLQLGATQVAYAQGSYPSRAITIINPFPPGGTSEIVTRPLAAALEPIVKQPVVIETKAGAAGAIGAQFVATAAPDGYTLLSHITSLYGFAEVDKLFGRTPKFTRADFIPIARFFTGRRISRWRYLPRPPADWSFDICRPQAPVPH